MSKRKKIFTAMITVVTTVNMSLTALASATQPPTPASGTVTNIGNGKQEINGVVSDPAAGFGQEANVEWKGQIVTGDVISVVMPTSVPFYLKLKPGVHTDAAPNSNTETDTGFDMTISGAAEVVNNSTCSIELSCVNFSETGITYIDTADGQTKPVPGVTGNITALVDMALMNTAQKNPSNGQYDGAAFAANQLSGSTITTNPISFGVIGKPGAGTGLNTLNLEMLGKTKTDESKLTWAPIMKLVKEQPDGTVVNATIITTLKVSVPGKTASKP